MDGAAQRPRRRRRWPWLLLLALLGGWLLLRSLLEPARLSAFLLQQARDASGLEITLATPADVGFWPDLHLELSGLSARAPGASAPLLTVERVDAVLPWSALSADTLQLHSLRLHAPQLDVAALQAWLAARADAGPPAAPRWPRFDAAIEVDDGELRADGIVVRRLALQLAALRVDASTTLSASGEYQLRDADARPFALQLAARPRETDAALRLDALVLEWRSGAAPGATTLHGWIELDPARRLALSLAGDVAHWPAAWPPRAADAEAPAPVTSSLRFDGTPDGQGRIVIDLARGGDSLAGELQAGDLRAWLSQPEAPLPPLLGTLAAPRLQLGGVELQGVRIGIGTDAAPADDDDGDD